MVKADPRFLFRTGRRIAMGKEVIFATRGLAIHR